MNNFTQLPARQLTVTDLGCVRAERQVLSGISLSASSGEAFLLRGPNGAGKTSLLMCLAGYLPVSQGSITWLSRDPDQHPGEDIHFVGHLSAVKPSLSVQDNLTFWAVLNGGTEQLVLSALQVAGLEHAASLQAMLLSAGQTRRLSLARLLVAPRPIWLLDEPTAALDSEGDRWVAQMIDAHLKAGGIVIAATHLDLMLDNSGQITTLTLGGAS